MTDPPAAAVVLPVTPPPAPTLGGTGWTTPQPNGGAYTVLPDGGTVTSRRGAGPSTFHTYGDGTMGWTTPQGDGAYTVLPDGGTVTSRGAGPTVFHNYAGGRPAERAIERAIERPGTPATAMPPPFIGERPPRTADAR